MLITVALFNHENTKSKKHEISLNSLSCFILFRAFVINSAVLFLFLYTFVINDENTKFRKREN